MGVAKGRILEEIVEGCTPIRPDILMRRLQILLYDKRIFGLIVTEITTNCVGLKADLYASRRSLAFNTAWMRSRTPIECHLDAILDILPVAVVVAVALLVYVSC